MTSRGKKIFLIASIVVPFIIYSAFYYAPLIRNAPFKEKNFISLEYKWGVGTELENSYNSATGEFKYLDRNDSLITRNIKLSIKDVKYLDSIADVQGFWNLPSVIANSEKDLTSAKQLRYVINFIYKTKSKEVIFSPSFKGNEKMKGAASMMQKEIELMLIHKEAEGVK